MVSPEQGTGTVPQALHMVVDLEAPRDKAAFSDLSRRWLDGAVTDIADEQLNTVAATELPSGSLSRHVGPFGPEGTPWGSLIVRADRKRSSLRAYSPASWKAFLKSLDTQPEDARVAFSSLDRHGQPGGGHLYEFSVQRLHGDRWMRLQGRYQPPRDATVSWDSVAGDWADFLTGFIENSDDPAAFGCVMDDSNGDPRTPLERALRLGDEALLDAGMLRGYSWTTVLSPALAERCGGMSGLERFGFDAVTECPNGAVAIRATEHVTEYSDDAVARLFRAIRRVLPAGEPLPSAIPNAVPWKLVYRDAASDADPTPQRHPLATPPLAAQPGSE